jgi:hypothetical protein
MRNMPAERGDLRDHRLFIGSLDRRKRVRHHNRAHHRKRSRQADLKSNAPWQLAAVTRRHEVEIGRPRLARVTKLAEMNILRFDAVRQREQRKLVGRPDRT